MATYPNQSCCCLVLEQVPESASRPQKSDGSPTEFPESDGRKGDDIYLGQDKSLFRKLRAVQICGDNF